jgi:glyoxylase-like metal-dependent hydrolase (beta-lactamase superfamily II)
MKQIMAAVFFGQLILSQAMSQELPKATVVLAAQSKKIKIHTLVAPDEMFANTSHVIELPHELIIVDGQFFAPYAWQLKAFTDSLKKPVTRFYISHDHPDHYIGFGDAFPNVEVYALEETKTGIEKAGLETLKQRQQKFGPVIAKTLKTPTHIQQTGTEVIDGITFIFERSTDNEAAVSLVIKLPEIKAYIAQDIVYNKTHLFIAGSTFGWRKALQALKNDTQYTLILPGHGKPTGRAVIDEDLKYLDVVDKVLATTKTRKEYRSRILAAYPDYGGEHLMDIYLEYYLKNNWQD